MKKYLLLLFVPLVMMAMTACGGEDEPSQETGGKPDTETGGGTDSDDGDDGTTPRDPSKSNNMMIFAHYMPWFETPATAGGQWGWHWKMNTRDPNVVDASGRRQIASHYYPLTGPYASSDNAILDYQCLLMKYSGVDGVMVDWYGTSNLYDYAGIKRNTEALAQAVERNGLQLAIVYEDATLNNVSSTQSGKVSRAKQDLDYLQKNFFNQDYYTRVGGKPLLLVFGPQGLTTQAQWTEAMSVLSATPCFVCLNGHSSRAGTLSQGEYVWVNPSPDYSVATRYNTYIAGAMPGFWDYYVEGGDRTTGYTTYDREDGALFARQLNAALKAGLKYVQVSTWNDYGEGTTIEPTLEYGYKYLTALQQFAGVNYKQSHLELIFRWYKMRVAHPGDARVEQARVQLAALHPDKAQALIEALEKAS